MRFSRQEYWNGLPCLPPGEELDKIIQKALSVRWKHTSHSFPPHCNKVKTPNLEERGFSLQYTKDPGLWRGDRRHLRQIKIRLNSSCPFMQSTVALKNFCDYTRKYILYYIYIFIHIYTYNLYILYTRKYKLYLSQFRAWISIDNLLDISVLFLLIPLC